MAAPGAPRGEHGIRVIAEGATSRDTAFVSVFVYDLDIAAAADTLTIAVDASDATSVLIDSEGFFGDVRLGNGALPSGALAVPPSFGPTTSSVKIGAASVVTVRVDGAAAPGTYDLTLCATIVADPLGRCHSAPLTLVVPDIPGTGTCGDFGLRLDFDPITVAPGAADVVHGFVDRAPGFAGQVEPLLVSAPNGPPWAMC
jgi:hypothetical protein